jgi:Zn-dependent protease/predicted transcriptional regulator
MKWSWPIGRIRGIELRVHATFLILLAWLALVYYRAGGTAAAAIGGVLFTLALFASVVLHELGHALVARRFGVPTRDITLLPIGGVARLEYIPDKPKQELAIALAGPAVTAGIALVLALALRLSGISLTSAVPAGSRPGAAPFGAVPFLVQLMWVNVTLLLFNLLPAFPMDGGRVLRAVLALKLQYTQATRIAAIVGQAIALVFGVVGFFYNPMLMFVALFVFLAASEEHALVRSRASLSGLPARAAMISEFEVLDAHDSLQAAVDRLMAGSQQDFPILESGAPVGLLTRAELLMGLQRSGPLTPIGEVIVRDHLMADAGEPLEEALKRMREHQRPALPVVSGGRLVGMLTLENVSELLLVQQALNRQQPRF